MPTVYAGLFTSSPGETGVLSGEVVGNNYARVELTSKMGAATLATGVAANTSAVTFSVPSGSWGLTTHLGVMDSLTIGNVLLHIPLANPMLVGAGSAAPSFAIGKITLTAGFDGVLSQLTKYLAKKWIDHLLGKAAFTAPAACYVGMFSADPTSDGSLTNEIATGGAARQSIADLMEETVLATGISVNGDSILFPTPTAGYSVTHLAVLDAVSSGNMLMRKARNSTLNVAAGSAAVRIDIGGLQLRAD